MRKLLHTRAPTSAIDSCSVGKPKTTLMGTGMHTARLQASCTELLITRYRQVVHDKSNNLRKQLVHHGTTRKGKVARHLYKGTVSLRPLLVQLDWPMSCGFQTASHNLPF